MLFDIRFQNLCIPARSTSFLLLRKKFPPGDFVDLSDCQEDEMILCNNPLSICDIAGWSLQKEFIRALAPSSPPFLLYFLYGFVCPVAIFSCEVATPQKARLVLRERGAPAPRSSVAYLTADLRCTLYYMLYPSTIYILI